MPRTHWWAALSLYVRSMPIHLCEVPWAVVPCYHRYLQDNGARFCHKVLIWRHGKSYFGYVWLGYWNSITHRLFESHNGLRDYVHNRFLQRRSSWWGWVKCYGENLQKELLDLPLMVAWTSCLRCLTDDEQQTPAPRPGHHSSLQKITGFKTIIPRRT